MQIVAIDIVLGGDNAVVIALASRRLPARQRNLAIFWGVFGAIALRVELRAAQVEAAARYHRLLVDIERLTAISGATTP